MLARGEKPTLDDVAAEARVSRATTYRYFPGLDALLNEAAVDLLMPEPDELFAVHPASDPFERLERVDEAIDTACREREAPLRLMLARALERSIGRGPDDPPLRQNRRVPLIEAALAPLEPRIGRPRLTRLAQALALVVGTEGFIALNDVVGLDRDEARHVRRWAMDALVAAALRETYG